MNCSTSVNHELGKLLQTSYMSHFFFFIIFDREVEFLVWWPGSGGGGVQPHDQARLMMMYAARPSSGYIV